MLDSSMRLYCHKQSLTVLVLCYEPRRWGSAGERAEDRVLDRRNTEQRAEYYGHRQLMSSDVQRGAQTERGNDFQKLHVCF